MTDVVDLRAFYGTQLGVLTRKLLNQAIQNHWDGLKGMNVLGLGFATPYIGLFRYTAQRSLCFMPAHQGVIHWPTNKPSKVALIDETLLPIADAQFDRVLLVHSLEHSRHPHELLEESWRILAANGRILLIVPNRASLWAQRENTPFGHGRPFTRGQAINALKQAGFTPVKISESLYVPPTHSTALQNAALVFERLSRYVRLPLGGVHVIEAVKQVYKPLTQTRSRLIVPSLKTALQTNRQSND